MRRAPPDGRFTIAAVGQLLHDADTGISRDHAINVGSALRDADGPVRWIKIGGLSGSREGAEKRDAQNSENDVTHDNILPNIPSRYYPQKR